jgi:hypothetical protein
MKKTMYTPTLTIIISPQIIEQQLVKSGYENVTRNIYHSLGVSDLVLTLTAEITHLRISPRLNMTLFSEGSSYLNG